MAMSADVIIAVEADEDDDWFAAGDAAPMVIPGSDMSIVARLMLLANGCS
jgi:hypothetical protein